VHPHDYTLILRRTFFRVAGPLEFGHGKFVRSARYQRPFPCLDLTSETYVSPHGILMGAGSGTWGWSYRIHLYLNTRLKIARWHVHGQGGLHVPFAAWVGRVSEPLLALFPNDTWDTSPLYLSYGHPEHTYRVVGETLPAHRQERLEYIHRVLVEYLGFSFYDKHNLWYRRYVRDGFMLHVPETVEAALKVTHAFPLYNTDDFERAIDAQRRFKETLGTVQRMLDVPLEYNEDPYANETPSEPSAVDFSEFW